MVELKTLARANETRAHEEKKKTREKSAHHRQYVVMASIKVLRKKKSKREFREAKRANDASAKRK